MTLLLTKEEIEQVENMLVQLARIETRIRMETIKFDYVVDTFYHGRLAEAAHGAQRGLDNLLSAHEGYFNKEPTKKGVKA